jgi:hypothetical protein
VTVEARNRAKQLTRALYDLMFYSAGRMRLKRKPHSLGGFVPGSWRMFQPNALSTADLPAFDPRDSLHPFVKSKLASVSGGRFPAGNERVSGEDVAQALIGGFADADAGSDLDVSGAEGVVSEPQAGI